LVHEAFQTVSALARGGKALGSCIATGLTVSGWLLKLRRLLGNGYSRFRAGHSPERHPPTGMPGRASHGL